MDLTNLSKRLISINTGSSIRKHPTTNQIIKVDFKKVYVLLPAGPAVAVPDEVCESDFVKHLIKNGDVAATSGDKVDGFVESDDEDSVDPLMAFEKSDLKEMAENLGVVVKVIWNKTQLIAAIKEVQPT